MLRHSQRSSLILLVLSLAAFMASLDLFIVNVAFDAVGRDFREARLSQLSWVLNAYTIIYAALLVPAGRIVDRYGRKGGFLIGLGLFTASSAACAASGGLWWLVAFRAAQAVGAAVLTPASLGLVLATAAPEHRARSVRIWAATGALAAALGPVLGGLLVEASWRWVFLVNVPVGVAGLIAAALVIPRSRDQLSERLPDVIGAGLLAVAIGALTLALVQGSDWGWTDTRTYGAWGVSVAALVGFVARSARHAAPVVDPAVLRVRPFSWSNVTAFLFSVPFAGALLSIILWLQQTWEYSPIKTGLAVAPGPLMVPLFTGLAHRLARRVPIGAIISAGCILFGIGAVYNALRIGQSPDYAGAVLPGWLIAGAGVGLALPGILSSATVDLPRRQSATGSAVVNMSRQIGTVIGVSLLVVVIGTPVGNSAALAAFQRAWWAVAAVSGVAAVAAFGVTPATQRDQSKDSDNAGDVESLRPA